MTGKNYGLRVARCAFRKEIFWVSFLFLIFNAQLAIRNSEAAPLFHEREEELERGRAASLERAARDDRRLSALLAMFEGRYAEGLSRLAISSSASLDSLSRPEGRLLFYLQGMAAIEPSFTQDYSTAAIHFRSARRDGVIQYGAGAALEACRGKIRDWLDVEPNGAVLVEVYPTKKTFAHASALGDEIIKKSGVIGIAKFGRIMIIAPENLPFGYAWQDTLCHEYIHHALKIKAGLSLPLWFQEGMARANESIWRGGGLELPPGDQEELWLAAKEGRLVSFERMEPSLVYLNSEGEISLAFTQTALAIEEIRPQLAKLLQRIFNGKNFNEAFEAAIGQTLREFEIRLWAKWLKEAEDRHFVKKTGALRTVLSMDPLKDPEKIFLGPRLQNLLRLGDQMRQRGNLSAALGIYNQAKDLEPQNPYVLARIARGQAASGQSAKALDTVKTLIQSNPRWPPGYELAGELYENQGLYDDAIERYRRYFDYNPYHQALVKKVAFLYLDLGQKWKAHFYLEKVLLLDPKDTEAREALEAIDARQ
ncbi:MAG: tetratricopeptide repeat protein [Elusimicrobia bacterium]|nr:tetratricopeptide repeat protein [Elusimicrobiota bacterium]